MVELYIDNKKIDKTEEINFSINKSWLDLTDPATIKSDYSKTINIPITKNNIAIFGNWNKPDKADVAGGTTGLYFDPNSKIPFSLEINGDVFVTGYVKFVKCNYSSSDKNFEVTLNGIVTDLFNKLKEIDTADLDDYFLFPVTLNAHFVEACWKNTYKDGQHNPVDVLGFSLCNNGKLPNFENGKIIDYSLYTDGNIQGKMVDIPEGDMYEGWNKEYRSYYQRPFVRIPALFSFLKSWCNKNKYNLTLDKTFFNELNPWYWKGVLLLNQLDTKLSDNVSTTVGTTNTFTVTKTPTHFFTQCTWVEGSETQRYKDDLIPVPYCNNNIKINLGKFRVIKTDGTPLDSGYVTFAFTVDDKKVYYNANMTAGGYTESDVILEYNYEKTSDVKVWAGIGGYQSCTRVTQSPMTVTITATKNVRSYRKLLLSDCLGSDFNFFTFVVNYCKLFGLSFISKGKNIEIKSRDSLFSDSKIYDLLVDKSSYTLEPYRFENYAEIFDYKDSDVTYNKQFKEDNNFNYGAKKLLTGYNFNTTEHKLFSSFNSIINENNLQILLQNENLVWNSTNNDYQIEYNNFPFPTFTKTDSVPYDTVNKCYALGFENKVVDKFLRINVSDDCKAEKLNQKYCWHSTIITESDNPVFCKSTQPSYVSSYITYNDVNYSYLFTEPNVNYLSNDTPTREIVNGKINCKYIYKTFWENYLKDRYFTNSKKLTTKILLKPDVISNFSFGKLYYLDSVLWHINSIKDYNPNSYEPTVVELVEITNKNNYKTNMSYGSGTISWDYVFSQNYYLKSTEQYVRVKVYSSKTDVSINDFYIKGGAGKIISLSKASDGVFTLTVRVGMTYDTNNVLYLYYKLSSVQTKMISTITREGTPSNLTLTFETYNKTIEANVSAGGNIRFNTNKYSELTFSYDTTNLLVTKSINEDSEYSYVLNVKARNVGTYQINVMLGDVIKANIRIKAIRKSVTVLK